MTKKSVGYVDDTLTPSTGAEIWCNRINETNNIVFVLNQNPGEEPQFWDEFQAKG